ncbi:MAG: endonuclease [Bacteroidota bacterium]
MSLKLPLKPHIPWLFSLFVSIILLSLIISQSFAQAPAGYYDAATGKTGATLQVALYNIIKNHNAVSYNGVWSAFYTTDLKSTGKIWDMYSDIPGGTPPYEYTPGTGQCGTSTKEGDCYSREHSMPQSYFAGAAPMYTDLFHLFPVDQYVNGTGHSNYPFGTVATPAYTSQNGSKRGPCSYPGYTGTVFEPLDAYKGDFARAYFYMATCYQNLIAGWQTNAPEADAILNGTAYPAFETWFLNLLLAWNAADPVSAKETARNEAVYAIQSNRNPYIDHPGYVMAVWQPGGIKAEPSNHPTGCNSVAGSPSYSAITLTWTDATGAVLPDGYLIKGSTTGFSAITDPIDGAAMTDGELNKNIPYGSQFHTFTALTSTTTYYFKIYSYTNSGTDINYKTDGTVQTASRATTEGTSVLQAGDIAIIGYGTDDPDKFAFILLTNIAGSTQITFTDNAWTGTALLATEQTGTWTAPPDGLLKGSVIRIQGTVVTGGGTISAGLTGLATAGDQILAYQGTSGSPAFIAGCSSTNWISTGTPTSNESYLPSGLSLYFSAITFSTEMDNGYYNGPLTLASGTANSFLCNSVNWLRDNNIQTFPTWLFTVAANTVIDVNASVQNLTIASNETVTIPPGKQLTVNGTLVNAAGNGGLVIGSDVTGTGSLIHSSNFIAATVNRYVTGAGNSWHLLSSPVSQTIAGSDFVPGASNFDFYCWNEPTGEWVNFKNTTTEPTWNSANGTDFIPGRGYLVAYQESNPTKQFQGLLNNGAIHFDLSFSGAGSVKGANLLGNPYPSAIDWKAAAGWTRPDLVTNGTGKDMWIWNESAGNYGVFNSAGATGTNGVTLYIPAGQGFFVKAASAGTLSIDNPVRVHQNPSYLKSTEELSNVLTIRATNQTNLLSDEVVVEFGHDEPGGGAEKWFSMYDYAPGLYLLKNEKKYSIGFLGSPSPQTVALNFMPGVNASFQISAGLLNSFPAGTRIILEDLKTGVAQDLMQYPLFSFNALNSDDPGRFLIHFGGAIGIGEKGDKDMVIYSAGQSIRVQQAKNKELKGEVFVYTIQGRQILHQPLNTGMETEICLNAPRGYYLVKVITDKKVCSEKIFIQ